MKHETHPQYSGNTPGLHKDAPGHPRHCRHSRIGFKDRNCFRGCQLNKGVL